MDMIRSQPGIEVVGAATHPTELLLAAGSLDVDVVVVGAPPSGEPPGIASHLLDQYPHLRVLAVASDGRQVLLCDLQSRVVRIPIASPQELARTIGTAASSW
jgi:DNA-binding NarL/FixJ family response regulator